MKKYAKVINEYKQCDVGLGDDTEFYQSIGMTEMEVEQGHDGVWYVAGYAPQQTVEEKNEQIRQTRAALYTEHIDHLHAQKTKDIIMGEWSDEKEQEYIAKVKKLTIKIRDENPYIE